MPEQVNRADLETKVQAMYRDVAQNPHGEFHFEMGRAMAERLGYRPADLDRIPAEAIDSFAGVGHYFHFLDDMEGARVLDLGSGSGMDSFLASLITGPTGTVIGLDMTDAQRAKAESLRRRFGVRNVNYVKGYIDAAPFEDGSFDVVVSNGVINLAVNKPQVFREIARLLRPGGRLAIADIVTDVLLPETISCDKQRRKTGQDEQDEQDGGANSNRTEEGCFSASHVLSILSKYLYPGAQGCLRSLRHLRALCDEPKYVIVISNASTKETPWAR